MNDNAGDKIETVQDALDSGMSEVQIWHKRIKAAKDQEKDWRKRAEVAIKVYEALDQGQPFNVLHSNVATMIPALYNSVPVPDVRRRYNDADPVGKMAVDMMERALSYEIDTYEFSDVMRAAVRESVIVGRGVIRVRFDPEYGPMPGPDGQPMVGEDGQPIEVVTSRKLRAEHVPWDKYYRGPGRDWDGMPYEIYEHDLTREELIKLNPERGAQIAVGGMGETKKEGENRDADDEGIMKTVCVYEVWDKTKREVLFVAENDKDEFVARQPDPLQLENFYARAKPLQHLQEIGTLTPLVPYDQYKWLAEKLQAAYKRRAKLLNQLKVRGIAAGSLIKDARAIADLDDGEYIAGEDASVFASGGGLEKGILHWPLEPTVAALQQVEQDIIALESRIDKMSGVADIMRGAVDPREKLGQSQLKAQFGSMRVQEMQQDVARLARDIFRLKAEIIAEQYDPQTLMEMTGLGTDQEGQQLAAQAFELLRSSKRSFRIDIETDSTIRADMARNQEVMNGFLAGTAQFAQGMVTVGQAAPFFIPAIVEVYSSFARHFKLGKQAEDALEKLSGQAQQMAQAASQPQPDPEADAKKAELEARAAERQDNRAMARETHQMNMQAKQMDMQAKERGAQIDVAKAQAIPQRGMQ